ncbi:MAG: transcriptional regulator [Bacteroidota bacterium]
MITLLVYKTGRAGMENGHLMPSIDIVQRLMKVFAVSADQLLNEDENSVVDIQNHELNEQLALINQLDEDEKNALIKIINSMLTKKRMKDLLDGKIKLAT